MRYTFLTKTLWDNSYHKGLCFKRAISGVRIYKIHNTRGGWNIWQKFLSLYVFTHDCASIFSFWAIFNPENMLLVLKFHNQAYQSHSRLITVFKAVLCCLFSLAGPCHSTANFQGIGSVDAEKYQEDFGFFGSGPDVL